LGKNRAEAHKGGGNVAGGIVFLFLYILIGALVTNLGHFPYIWALLLWFLFFAFILLYTGIRKLVKPQPSTYFDAKEKPAKDRLDAIDSTCASYREKGEKDLQEARKLLPKEGKFEGAKALPTTSKEEPPKERLTKLQELHDQGLISEEEYEAKRQEILKEI
jgi:hypothetical protein